MGTLTTARNRAGRTARRRLPGSARRRVKATARAGYTEELDLRWAYRLDRLPETTPLAGFTVCGCGYRAWVIATPAGDTVEDFEWLDGSDEAHDASCPLMVEEFA